MEMEYNATENYDNKDSELYKIRENKEPIEAVFFDIDGTIKPAGEKIPYNNVKGIEKLYENGIKLYLATGRCYSMIEELANEAELDTGYFDGFVCENGSYVVADGKEIYNAGEEDHKEFSEAKGYLIETVFPQFESEGVYLQDNRVNLTFKPREDSTREESDAMVERLRKAVEKSLENTPYKNHIELVAHWDALDIMPIGIDKSIGISKMADYGCIDISRAIYAGDNLGNDLEAFDYFADKKGVPVSHRDAKIDAKNYVKEKGGIVYDVDIYNFTETLADDIIAYNEKIKDDKTE